MGRNKGAQPSAAPSSDSCEPAHAAPPSAGTELLRALAGLAARNVHVGRHEVRARIVDIHRDALGRVIGSTEHIEEVQYLDTTGDWLQ